MIPRIIHYCWFGKGEMPDNIKICMESWRQHCSGWQIMRWDETNSQIDVQFAKDAYLHQKWAYVSDYIRFVALYQHGGIYLDTDMLLTKPLDEFLSHRLFIGRFDEVSAGWGIIGAEKNSEWCSQCIEYYRDLKFDVVSPQINTIIITQLLYPYGFKEENITQNLSNGMVVYNSEWFYPIPCTEKFTLDDIEQYCTKNTHAVHLWNCSWQSEITMLAEGKWREGLPLAWKRIKRTPFLPARYYLKLVKYTLICMHLYPRKFSIHKKHTK